ncbi:MFS transporter [Alicyclobacillus cycloheptanicus]|uniref:DHA1 family multidrug resistance protein B-like MFS transporter n=1 Tax=Alicyclobacillus cycloheptanicus TaxID=1457 RepID=A0ABT9XHP4_9BACL|nr:MFS transporter [Alicyclobacillus cycloheptanicus]MDQ0189833.1 DHA1 family multidrug resistance protein B-like MFS transporter [Alicyclobacillus cycloheptanicus]WDM02480.1 MFS transporter [Alicyclobacillus cycloheptanicus]
MRFRDFHRNVKIRISVSFAFGIVQSTTMPFMAIYFAHNFGESLTGLTLAAGIVASVLSGAVGGYYADRVGRRNIMMWAEAVFLLAYLAMAIANSPQVNAPVVTLAAFLVTNVCWGVYGPADDAMLLDVTTAENRQTMYGIFYWINNLTMAIGTSVGAFLFESHRFALFAAMSLVVLATWLSTVFLLQETYVPSAKAREAIHPVRGMFRSYRRVLGDRAFVRYILAGLCAMYGEFQLQNYIGIHLAKTVPVQSLFSFSQFTLSVDGVRLLGWLQTENTILVVLLVTLATRIIQGRSERGILFVAVLLQTLGYSVITVTSMPLVALIAMLFATIGEVTGVSVRQAYLGDLAPEDARSAYVAVNGMTFQGTRLLTSLAVALGAVVPAWGMALICLVLGIGGMLLYQSVVEEARARRTGFAGVQTKSENAVVPQ